MPNIWKLRRNLLYKYVCLANENICFRCGKLIEEVEEFTVDHKRPWRHEEDMSKLFMDLNNIAFSHHSCNSAAARRPNKVYASRAEAKAASNRRCQAKRIEANKRRRARLRAASLPYT